MCLFWSLEVDQACRVAQFGWLDPPYGSSATAAAAQGLCKNEWQLSPAHSPGYQLEGPEGPVLRRKGSYFPETLVAAFQAPSKAPL